jgi:hypothetical protein
MEDELSLEEELLQVAGRNRPTEKRRRHTASDSEEEGQVIDESGEYGGDGAAKRKSKVRRRSPATGEGNVCLNLILHS